MEMKEKFGMQSSQYEFPYHFLVDLKKREFCIGLSWGLDYFNYMNKAIALVEKYVKRDILDIGCGDGYLLNNLKKSNVLGDDVRAVGMDLDEQPIKFAQAFSHGIDNLEFIVEDVNNYLETFNLITIVEALEHIPDDEIQNFVFQIDRLLQNGGTLIVSVPSKTVPLNKKHYRHYNIEMLAKYWPNYEILEKFFITNRKSMWFGFIEKLLCNKKFNLNFSFFKKFLFFINGKYFSSVKEDCGAHVVVAFRKKV